MGNVNWAAVALVVLAVWLFRYDVTATLFNQRPAVYLLDRWTGNVRLCAGNQCVAEPLGLAQPTQ